MAVSLDHSNMVQGTSTQYGQCQTQIGSSIKLTKKQNRKNPIFSSPPTLGYHYSLRDLKCRRVRGEHLQSTKDQPSAAKVM